MKEGVPALFALIEDGQEHYRNDEIFDQFNVDYEKEVDGSYFSLTRDFFYILILGMAQQN